MCSIRATDGVTVFVRSVGRYRSAIGVLGQRRPVFGPVTI